MYVILIILWGIVQFIPSFFGLAWGLQKFLARDWTHATAARELLLSPFLDEESKAQRDWVTCLGPQGEKGNQDLKPSLQLQNQILPHVLIFQIFLHILILQFHVTAHHCLCGRPRICKIFPINSTAAHFFLAKEKPWAAGALGPLPPWKGEMDFAKQPPSIMNLGMHVSLTDSDWIIHPRKKTELKSIFFFSNRGRNLLQPGEHLIRFPQINQQKAALGRGPSNALPVWGSARCELSQEAVLPGLWLSTQTSCQSPSPSSPLWCRRSCPVHPADQWRFRKENHPRCCAAVLLRHTDVVYLCYILTNLEGRPADIYRKEPLPLSDPTICCRLGHDSTFEFKVSEPKTDWPWS